MNYIANNNHTRYYQIIFFITMATSYPCFGGRARVVLDSVGVHGTAAVQKPTGSVAEVPYWAVQYTYGGTTKTKYFATTAWTYSVNLNPGKNILTDWDAFDNANAFLSTIGDVRNLTDCSEPTAGTDWRRNYNGVLSAYVLNATFDNNDPWMFAIMHCENKNESIWRNGCQGARCDYESTVISAPQGGWVWPDDYAGGTSCSSGVYIDSSLNYVGMIGMTCCPIPTYDGKYLQVTDRGPILWPSSGYVDVNGIKLTNGLRHPTSFIDGDMIYCFFKDDVFDGSGGIKVARCPTSLYGFEGYWKTWYVDPCNGETWVDSLPANFDKGNIANFYNVPGGKSSPITDFDAYYNSYRFSVAKISGTNWYLSTEYSFYSGGTEIGLRVSRDLVHWSYITTIPGTNGYLYPIFANTTCTNNTLINKDNFYLLASVNYGTDVKYIPMDISISYDVPADYDGNGKTDFTTYRPSKNQWYTRNIVFAQLGSSPNDIPLTGDIDGDHKADWMIYEPANGSWHAKYSGGAADANLGSWGTSYDIPLLGDVDGDGKDERVIFRPTNAVWYVNDGGSFGTEYEFGKPGDIPFLADRDGDGKADRCVWRPSDGTWHFKFANGLPNENTSAYGLSSDVPLLGDYDNDGKVERAYFRPSTGTWYVTDGGSWNGEEYPYAQWGQNGHIPLIGDWDGDGITDRGIYSPSTAYWYTNCSTGSSSPSNFAWGCTYDVPLGSTLYGQQGLFYEHPESQIKTTGQSVTFSIKAFGRGLSYQWKKNGTSISGAVSDSYTISSVSGNDAGNYSCTITIPLTCPVGSCTKTSLEASLTVN